MKKYVALILCLAMLSGCNADDKKNEASTPATTTAINQQVQESEAEEEAPSEEDISEDVPEQSEDDPEAIDNSGFKKYNIDEAMKKADYLEYETLSFLTPEQQNAFNRAFYLVYGFELSTSPVLAGFDIGSYSSDQLIDGRYLHTGYSYDSVMSAFKSVLSEDIIAVYENYGQFMNKDGEFIISDGARGANIYFDRVVFEPEYIKGEPDAVFKGTVYYSDPDTGIVDEQTTEVSFRMERTANGWKFKEFQLWY